MSTAAKTAVDIRPFQVEIAEEELAELRRRIEATRWPSKELVPDRSQGVQLATLIRQPGSIDDRTFEIAFDAPGVEAYAFTFG